MLACSSIAKDGPATAPSRRASSSCLRTLDRIAAMKVEDAPATRSEADYNFIANEIFVTFATAERTEPIKRLGIIPGTKRVTVEGDDARRARKGFGRRRRNRARLTMPTKR